MPDVQHFLFLRPGRKEQGACHKVVSASSPTPPARKLQTVLCPSEGKDDCTSASQQDAAELSLDSSRKVNHVVSIGNTAARHVPDCIIDRLGVWHPSDSTHNKSIVSPVLHRLIYSPPARAPVTDNTNAPRPSGRVKAPLDSC
ncbi:hypothetical protein EYF80_002503 [Liparis tanakae]|uniref:Uncharacterized protein n=1 Tax=Liparis tanakae TaxID=230148 RepID=A0A4Z2JBD0_9TELE|nr:hypothetical protein EYF80_002503 [Liparis tanakae]